MKDGKDKNKDKIASRIKYLRDELEIHRIAYHVNDSPKISDEAYDSLMSELVKLENENPEFKSDTSPSVRVGGNVLDKFVKIKHKYRQWSFDNVFNFDELLKWEERNNTILFKSNSDSSKEKINTDYTYVCEMKIDGLKIILNYENGKLVNAATRGDGEIGEDVTENIKTIKSIPLKLKEEINISIVGECWIQQEDLEIINEYQKKNNLPIYANTRNLAAGTLRQLDSSVVAKRNLKFFAYDMDFDEGEIKSDAELRFVKKTQTQKDELEFLKENGFMVNDKSKIFENINQVQNYYEENVKSRNSYSYGVDGMVIKINERSVWAALGYTAKSPRAGIAYKFPAEQVTTVVESISFQVGRTGTITPVANLRPVLVSGSTVSRATLHNEDEIKRLGIMMGDTVVLQKAGDVIPEVVEVLSNLRDEFVKEIIFPRHCPSCSSLLIKRKVGKEKSVNYFCDNINCDAKHTENIIHFVSKKGLNIEGLGEKIIEEFMGLGIVHDYASIYEIKKEDIKDLFGYGEKSADNILNSIQKSKSVELHNFIYALGILGAGEVAAKDLAKNYKDLDNVMNASAENILCIKNMGPVMAENIYSYFKDEKNKENIKRLLQYLNINNSLYKNETDKKLEENKKFYNKTFVITGTLTNSRDYYKNIIEEFGGKVSGSVSSKTNYLLAGDDAGSKLSDAKDKNVNIIDEKMFLEMVA